MLVLLGSVRGVQCGMHGVGTRLVSQNTSNVARVGKRHVCTEVSHEMLVFRKELFLAFSYFSSSRPAQRFFGSECNSECDFSRQAMVGRCKWFV